MSRSVGIGTCCNLLEWRISFSENRCPPSDQVRGQAFPGYALALRQSAYGSLRHDHISGHPMPPLSATDVIRLLDLKPHPEGGHFCESFRDAHTVEGGRAASTAIYFLLARGERSHWHRVDAAEVWHYYAGAPLALDVAMG